MPESVLIKLHGGERATLPEGLCIKLDSIMFEEIIAHPDNEAMYPAGSGIVIQVTLSDGIDSVSATFNELSDGYTSARSFAWKHYRLELTRIEGYNNALVSFKVHTTR